MCLCEIDWRTLNFSPTVQTFWYIEYIVCTPIHYLYAAQRGRDFQAPGLERGIHFRGIF